MNPFAPIQKDSYKVGHKFQYPPGTDSVYSNFTARSGKLANVPDSKGVYFFGLQHFIMDYLSKEWNQTFFKEPKSLVIQRYRSLVSRMGTPVDTKHLEALHDLGYLPLCIKALPEGSFIPYGVPMLTIKETIPEFYWLTNMIESVLSAELWLPVTSATTYMAYRANSLRYSRLTCDNDDHVPFQNHDFSMRGMQGRHAAAISGAASLAMGSYGTDTISALELLDHYYAGHEENILGTSVPATEHSVVCSGGEESELDTLRHLLTHVYPAGFFSYVADSWDYWKVITEYLPELKPMIMNRDGRLIMRPDSGDPVDIICGLEHKWGHSIVDRDGKQFLRNNETLARREVSEAEIKGTIECLWDVFGGTVNDKGFKVLDSHIGVIYGDSITIERQERIMEILTKKGFASSNIVFGVGSYTYGYATRDTHGMAMKSTYSSRLGKGRAIFKLPKTGDGTKNSARGLLMVTQVDGKYQLVDNVSIDQERHGCLELVFFDGVIMRKQTVQEIRARATSYLGGNFITNNA